MKILKLLMLLVLSAPMLQGAAIDNLNTNLSSTTMKVYDKAGNRLVLYTNIPGADADTVRTNRSEFYTIHIRSAQTDYEWVEVYANATRCYGRDVNLSKMTWPGFTVGGTSLFADLDGHYDMRGWTHTYANIEMTPDSPIEVRITKKDAGWQINGTNVFQTANAYPAHRAHKPIVEGGQVFVTIDKPAQITIDINGQFDGFDTGKSYHDNVNSNRKYLHALTIFANPTLESKGLTRHLPKPGGLSGGVYYINPGATYPTVSQQSGASNIVFNPGVHNVGLAKIVLKDKKYYIPGDALVYGTLTTRGGSTANDAGYNITIYGYGTLSGAKLPHPKTIGKEGNEPAEDEHKGILIDNANNTEVFGITMADPSFHTINLLDTRGTATNGQRVTFIRWAKAMTWRANGDGLGAMDLIEDTFVRSQDDCTYIKGDRIRLCTWTDYNGGHFVYDGIDGKPELGALKVIDNDVIFSRHNSTWKGGRVFTDRNMSGDQGASGNLAVNVLTEYIRITDPLPSMQTFNLYVAPTIYDNYASSQNRQAFKGLTFRNITQVATNTLGYGQVLKGNSSSKWENIVFDNVRVENNQLLTGSGNFVEYQNNLNVTFPNTATPAYTISREAKDGYILVANSTITTSGAFYPNNTVVSVTAVAYPGLVFDHWEGNLSGSANPANITVNGNKSIKAVFVASGVPQVTVTATDASAAEPSDNGTFTFTRSGSTTAALTVNFTASGTASSGTDYTSLGTSVTIAAGQASVATNVNVINDSTAESSETVIVTLATNVAYTVGSPSSATVNIADDDSATPSVTVTATDASAAEPSDNGTFTFTRSGSTTAALTVNFTASGTASSGTDYTSLGTSVTIAAGQASVATNVNVINDSTAESSETVIVTLASGAGYTIGSPSSATVTIADNDSSGSGEAVPWVVNFNGLANGTSSQGSPTTWATTRPVGVFQVSTNRLMINNGVSGGGITNEGVFSSGVINISGQPVDLSMTVQGIGTDAGDYVKLFIKTNGGAETLLRQLTGATATTNWTISGITGTNLQIVVRASVSFNDEYYYLDDLSVTSSGSLPSPWQTIDVGAVAATGSASYNSGTNTWTIVGSGKDIGSTADEFRYVYQTTSIDCSIVARVASMTNPNSGALAGVIIRETTNANAQSFMLGISPNNVVSIQYRTSTGGSTSNASASGQTVPKWLKLTRTGNLFAAYYSDDGATWTQVGTSQSINMQSGAIMGLAVCSHLDGTLCTSTMDNVTATP